MVAEKKKTPMYGCYIRQINNITGIIDTKINLCCTLGKS